MTLHPSFSRKKLQNTPVGLRTRSTKLASSAAPEPSEPIWINCRQPVFAIGLEQMLKKELLIHRGQQLPKGDVLSAIVLYAGGVEGIAEGVERTREANPDLPVLVFSLHATCRLPMLLSSLGLGVSHMLG